MILRDLDRRHGEGKEGGGGEEEGRGWDEVPDAQLPRCAPTARGAARTACYCGSACEAARVRVQGSGNPTSLRPTHDVRCAARTRSPSPRSPHGAIPALEFLHRAVQLELE